MSKIISIGTAVPAHRHQQEDILHFMQQVYAMNDVDNRKLKFLYHQSGIGTRHSVIPDYCKPAGDWKFYPNSENLEPFPSLELRMAWYNKYAAPLSVDAIRRCLDGYTPSSGITHLITVSCTGMSAPGLDLHIIDLMDLPKTIYRTSVNFMGCYAAIHAMKMADAICKNDTKANVLIVCTELCTLHFQKEPTPDNISSSLLFSDGAAAALITHDSHPKKGWRMDSFYAEIVAKGKKDMAWDLSGSGFLMTLSSYIPELIEEDFEALTGRALQEGGKTKDDITHWCIHPGGRRILDVIGKTLELPAGALKPSYDTLSSYGNMSSATILFVLKEMMRGQKTAAAAEVFGAAFGPGLTMETFLLSA